MPQYKGLDGVDVTLFREDGLYDETDHGWHTLEGLVECEPLSTSIFPAGSVEGDD